MAGVIVQVDASEAYVEEALLMRESGNIVYIRAIGHITANTCAELKTRVFGRLEAKPPVDAVYVDLEHCDYMDSTFMGLLVGFNKRFLRFAEKPITILKANDTCLKLLKTIGVSRLVSLSDENIKFPEPLENLNAVRKAEASMLLRAHEDLMELSEENARRFAALRSVLKQSVDEEQKDQ
ncbi:MAG: STAS domain-containing protein [Clostridia bacterium]|jgi:anti-anti-sigma factor|nr:STAS domain-containing protein [Spirochaetia bacterium]